MLKALLIAGVLVYLILAACTNPFVCYDSPSGSRDYSHLRPEGAFVSIHNRAGNSWRMEFMGDSAVLTIDQGDTVATVVYDVKVVGTHIEEVE